MNIEERQIIIDLRVALWNYVRACAACGGGGKLRSGRPCLCCGRAQRAINASETALREVRKEPA